MNICGYEKNAGLGIALNYGVNNCKYDLIARMDTDDIASKDRFEKELNQFKNNPELSMVGSNTQEFIDEITNVIYNHVTNLNLDGEEDEAVINVNWYDAITFCNELSLQNELDPAYILKNDHIYFDKKANGYRLPTVKEWECAKLNEEEIDNLEWTYDYDDENEIYKVVKGGIEESNMLPSESSDNVTFRIVKNA